MVTVFIGKKSLSDGFSLGETAGRATAAGLASTRPVDCRKIKRWHRENVAKTP
jgi:hypothetical protein